MFFSGNETEKVRVVSIGCAQETIVDVYCGIGCYVLPFLVHGDAAFVQACEWNPDAVDALCFTVNLKATT
jgi:tRNA G37 N-methylase Trm5